MTQQELTEYHILHYFKRLKYAAPLPLMNAHFKRKLLPIQKRAVLQQLVLDGYLIVSGKNKQAQYEVTKGGKDRWKNLRKAYVWDTRISEWVRPVIVSLVSSTLTLLISYWLNHRR